PSADRPAAQTAQNLLGAGRGRAAAGAVGRVAARGRVARWAHPAGRGDTHRAARTVAARPAGAIPQDRTGCLAATRDRRGSQSPGPTHDRGGRPADVAAGAGRDRRPATRWTGAGRVATPLTRAGRVARCTA